MSRAHCIDCGTAVVVDPTGLCPDGHVVGTGGARIEAAMGAGVPHPDEPEPWTFMVDLGPSDGPAEPPQPRTAQPPSVPDAGTVVVPGGSAPHTGAAASAFPAPPSGTSNVPSAPVAPAMPDTPAAPATPQPAPATPQPPPASAPPTKPLFPSKGSGAADASASETDDLLRELHSLSELEELADVVASQSDASATAQAARPTTSVAGEQVPAAAEPTPAAAPAAEIPSPEASGEQRDGLAELRALEAAVHALTGDGGIGDASDEDPGGKVTRLPSPESVTDEPDGDHLAEVQELFAKRPARLREPLAGQRPSQAGTPASDDSPGSTFQRTPWSTDPLDAGAEPHTSPPVSGAPMAVPPAAQGAFAQPQSRRSASGDDGGDGPIDLGNFTAKGNKVGNGKRRRKGR